LYGQHSSWEAIRPVLSEALSSGWMPSLVTRDTSGKRRRQVYRDACFTNLLAPPLLAHTAIRHLRR